ncbi:MAG: PKD domain-containing protein [Bacteroidota bacterium]|nr:PKD domain-containing protein [Bacteroidota bacterium]
MNLYRRNSLYTLFIFLFTFGALRAQVSADFSADIVSGCAPLVVQFTDLSTGNPDTWSWNFGNSNGSSNQNPGAIYTLPGQYTVTLTASVAGSSDVETKTNFIVVYAKPSADFLLSVDTTCVGQTVTYTDASVISPGGTPIASWNWDFGDGNLQTVASSPVTHSYTSSGLFPVGLIVTDQNGCTSPLSHNIFITNFPNPTFTATPAFSCTAPVNVTFTNTTTTVSDAIFLWRFGDGTTSASQNPTHNYAIPGSYNVTLIITQGGCTDSVVVPNRVVIQDITAGFTTSATSICSGGSITFTNTSNPAAASANWDFGDGNTSTSISPSHTYAVAGTYNVTLSATDANGCTGNSATTVTVDPTPVVNFTSNITQGCTVPLAVNFTDLSSGGGAVFNWNFGDGNSSPLQNPGHSYNASGTYTVTLTVSNAAGTCIDSLKQNNYITITLPVANFTTNPDSGCAPINIAFASSSTSPLDPIASYEWTFGDGNAGTTATSTTNNTYNIQGLFSPQLIVITATGCRDTFICNNCVKTGLAPVANFTLVDNSICFGQLAQFNETATGETGWKWLFGDGGNSLLPNPTHNYADTGTFQIQLVAFNNGCSDTSAIQTIRVDGPKASMTRTMSCVNYYDVLFNSTSVMADSVYWDFGDGGEDLLNTINPSHTYATIGAETVTLIATNFTTGCADTTTLTLTIAEPIAAFTTTATSGCYPFTVNFNGTSSQDEAAYSWDFGDLSTATDVSTIASPSYTYTSPGQNIIMLAIRDVNNCRDTIRDTLTTLGSLPGFTASTFTGCTPLPVTFTDTTVSDSILVQWIWDFGDGTIDTTNNTSISHTYTTPGNYAVTMSVRDTSGCTKTAIVANFIQPTFPFPSFAVDTFACAGDVITFNSAATVAVGESYIWDYGDGNIDTTIATSTTHSYNADNIYTVTLTVVDANGCDSSITKTIRILKPTADFSMAIINAGCGSLQSSFTDASTGFITNWLWDFGTGSTSALQNPIYTYTQAGTFDVSLVVTNSGGCKDTLVKTAFAVVPGPVGTYTFTPDSGCNPLTVSFDASSLNAENYFWDMGDGTVFSGVSDTTYIYTLQGLYNPILVLSNTMTNGLPCQLPATNLTGSVEVINLLDLLPSQTTLTLIEDSMDIVTLTTTGGTSPFTYSWTPTTALACTSTDCSATTLTGTGADIKYYITGTDANGCKGIDSVLVISTPCVNTTTPTNFFSPNADGANDVFYIPGVCKGESYSFKIFDRWGILMFDSEMRKQWWDGRTTAGVEAQDGVFYYILETSSVTYKGYVQLTR